MTANREKEKNTCKSAIENLAIQSGLAVVVLNGESHAVVNSNNNSICEILYSSEEFSPKCAEFCGRAFQDATQAGETISVKCHAGLHYQAVLIKLADDKQLVSIVGRTFLKSEEYKIAAERASSSDWQRFPSDELFKNVFLSSSDQEIEKIRKKIEKLIKKEKDCFLNITNFDGSIQQTEQTETGKQETSTDILQADEISKMIEAFHKNNQPEKIAAKSTSKEKNEEAKETAVWRSVFGSLLELEYKNAYPKVLYFLASRYSLSSLAWLENLNDKLEPVMAIGEFSGQSIELGISAEDSRLLEAIEKETSLELRERQSEEQHFEGKIINLFPISVGGKVVSGLLVGDKFTSDETKSHIARFIQNISAELEILRLREKIARQSRTAKAIQKLNETLKEVDGEEFWDAAAQISAELMRAERSSLLILNEESEELIVKSAVGERADIIKLENGKNIGKRVACKVLENGKPLIVKSVVKEGFESAPSEWKYKTDSFISYPIMIGGRKIGVLNITDAVDGETYNESDLELLETLSPQLAVAIDRKSLKRKTVELRQISITDSLTGLLNRRYLEERLTEEINRSQRHGYQMCFMMIDVDEFKSYNDNFSHPEGDKALQIVGQCLKATLRGADVAARYGGEEFSILLPQTNVNEAHTIAERLRRKVETTEFPNRQITISVGIAACSSESCDAKELMAAADNALYQAKRNGRNNVQIFRGKFSVNESF